MRRAMICVSVMLAIVQLWPMVFGRTTPSVVAVAAPVGRNAEAMVVPPVQRVAVSAARDPSATPQPAVARITAAAPLAPARPESCYKRYQRAYASCTAGDACRLRAADDWDLCEATGAWPS